MGAISEFDQLIDEQRHSNELLQAIVTARTPQQPVRRSVFGASAR
jgi:hypothetical protein